MRSSLTLGAVLCILALAQPTRAESDGFLPKTHRLEVGLYIGEVFAPGNHSQYSPTEGLWADLDSIGAGLGMRAAYFPFRYVGAEIEGQHFWNETVDDDGANQYGLRGHLIGQLSGRLTPFLVIGGGGIYGRSALLGNDEDPAFHWGIGGKYYASDRWLVRVEARHVVTEGENAVTFNDEFAHYVEILFGVSATLFGVDDGPVFRDDDGDGVENERDRCPTEAGLPSDGCPDPDPDGDGVMGTKDQCPETPGVAIDGCPLTDADGDGVPDDKDRCPMVAASTPSGCEGTPPEPTPEFVPAPESAPEPEPEANPDPDGDGILGSADLCPGQAETKNGYQDTDGCPDELPKAVQAFTGKIEGIQFASGSSTILEGSFPILDKAAKLLVEFTDIRIEVGGHTDNTGNAAYNTHLSQERAKAVRDYLISKGVAGDRLVAKGYGPDSPIASNDTNDGRAQNRRIEFKLLP